MTFGQYSLPFTVDAAPMPCARTACLLMALLLPSGIAHGQSTDPSSPATPGESLSGHDPLGHVPPAVGGRIEAAMRETAADDQIEHDGLLGPHLHGRGPVALEYFYVGEVFTNARGGISTRDATQYLGLFNLAMLVDFEKSKLPVPGRFFLLFQHTHGRGLTQDYVGDIGVLSNIDPFDNITQVSEYWWEFQLWDDFLTVRLGKQDANGEFHVVDMAGDFVHAMYGLPSELPGPTYPDPSAGAVLLARLNESWVAKAGIWDGLPNGANWGFSGSGATFTMAELERRHKLWGTLSGAFDIGFAHSSPIDMGPDDSSPEVYTLYFDIEQALWREDPSDEGNEQGLGVFCRYGTSFPKAEVEFKDYFAAGIVYRGLAPRRDDDVLGAAVSFNRHNLGGTGTETVVELFYKCHVAPWVTVQPDLQYIASPSGIYRDALVAGMRFEVVF